MLSCHRMSTVDAIQWLLEHESDPETDEPPTQQTNTPVQPEQAQAQAESAEIEVRKHFYL